MDPDPCAVLVPLLWGLQFVVVKAGLSAFPSLFFVGLRFAAVAALLLPFVGRPSKRELGPIIAISALVSFAAARQLPAPIAAAGERAAYRFLEFLTVQIRNPKA